MTVKGCNSFRCPFATVIFSYNARNRGTGDAFLDVERDLNGEFAINCDDPPPAEVGDSRSYSEDIPIYVCNGADFEVKARAVAQMACRNDGCTGPCTK